MSTVVFVSQKFPEKRLVSEHLYKYYPDSIMKEQILSDLKKHLNCSLDQFIIDLNVQVSLKEYEKTNESTENS